jgi:hypothetical protein
VYYNSKNIKENSVTNLIDLGFSKLELKKGYIRQTFTDDTTIDMEKALLLLGNFIIKIDKKPMPTNIFINESEAKKWLIKHIN